MTPTICAFHLGFSLVTNARDFVLVGEDEGGRPVRLESFRLADSASQFDAKLEHPRAFANEVGAGLGEYLTRVLSHAASLAEPKPESTDGRRKDSGRG